MYEKTVPLVSLVKLEKEGKFSVRKKYERAPGWARDLGLKEVVAGLATI